MLLNIYKLPYSLLYTTIIVLYSSLNGQTDIQKPDTFYTNEVAVNLPNDSLKHGLLNKSAIYKSGTEGIGIAAFIRGTAVLNIASNPLIVVDGMPYMNVKAENFDFTTADERDYAALIGLSQQDIKEVAIIQDGASAAQYGPRAINGVILVTTQRSTSGKLHVNYNFKNTLGYEPRGYDLLNGNEYIMLMMEEWHNASRIYTIPPELDYNNSNLYIRNNYTKNTDWYKAISQRALTFDNNLSVSGSKNKLAYRLSAGYLTHDGIIKKTGTNRFISRMVLDYYFSDRLKASFSLDYLYSKIDSTYKNDNILPIRELTLKKLPNASIYEMDELRNYTGEYLAPISDFQGTGWRYYNPVALINNSFNESKRARFIPTILVSYKLNNKISYTFNASYIIDKFSNKTFFHNVINDWWSTPDAATSYSEKPHQLYTQNQINYTPINSSNHFLSTTASFNTFNWRANNSKFNSHYEIVRLKYLAFNRYQLDVCGTGMKSSFNEESSTYYMTPAISLQWFISRESFMKSLNFINSLSLYSNYNSFVNPLYATGFASPLHITSFGNPLHSINFNNPLYSTRSINPEKPVNQEIGINLNILNRLAFNVNFYNRKIIDQYIGFYSYFEIINGVYTINNFDCRWDIQNKGWEISLQANIIRSKDFTTNFNLYLYKNFQSINKVSSYIPFPNYNNILEEGYLNGIYIRNLELNKTVGSVDGFKYQGVYATDADAIAKDKDGNTMYDINGAPIPLTYYNNYIFEGGDAKYTDLNYDGYINASDVTNIGNVNPKFSGSFGTTISYKNWWLGAFFNFRYGNDIVNRARMSLESMNTKDNQSKSVLRRWRAPGMDEPDMLPRAYLNNPVNSLGSDRFVEDGSFLRLKAITLKYEFRDVITKKLHLNNLSCFATCRNLFTITNYMGADPDIMLNTRWDKLGDDYNFTAITKEFTFGINIGI